MRRTKLAYLALAASALSMLPADSILAAPRMMSDGQAMAQETKLTQEIKWHKSLASAEEAARREGKPIFWVQMLGQLDGAT